MASKNEQGSGEVSIYDPGANQGRLDSTENGSIPFLGINPYLPDQVLAPGTTGIFAVNGSPEGVITAPPGSFALSDTGVAYIKGSGSGNVGWVALGAGGGGAPEAACYVGPDGTVGGVVFGTGFLKGCTVVRDSPGVYVVTLATPRASNTCVCFVSPQTSTGIMIDCIPTSDTERQIDAYDATGALTDSAFTFALFLI